MKELVLPGLAMKRFIGNMPDDEAYVYRQAMMYVYQAYQSSALWRGLVERVQLRDGRLCRNCSAIIESNGVVHHISYENWGKGDELEIDDCLYLCRGCHNEEHGSGKVDVPFWAQRSASREIRFEYKKIMYAREL